MEYFEDYVEIEEVIGFIDIRISKIRFVINYFRSDYGKMINDIYFISYDNCFLRKIFVFFFIRGMGKCIVYKYLIIVI